MKRPAEPDPILAGTLSLTALARRWKTSPKAIRRMLARQELNFVMINERIRVPEKEVERYERGRNLPQ